MTRLQQPISVVVPVFNEIGAAADSVRRMAALLRRLPEHSEVLFVDDGSTDGSGDALAAAAASAPGVRILAHRRNRGYGAALKTGIEAARHEVIVITDADGTYPASAIPGLAARVAWDEARMAVGARALQAQSRLRRIPKWFLRRLAEHLTQTAIPDMNSGLRAFRREDARRLRRLLPDGFSFTTTITMALLTEGWPVDFVPVRYAKRVGESKIRPIRDTMDFTLLILRTTLAFNPLRVFAPAAFAFLALGVALLAARLVLPNPVGVATTVVCFATGLQLFAVGLLADLVNRRGQ